MTLDFGLLELALIAAVPGVVRWLKPYLVKLPKLWLPILAALLGLGLQALVGWATGEGVSPAVGVIVGMLAVFVREVVDQTTKWWRAGGTVTISGTEHYDGKYKRERMDIR